jgi:hypothetical protein
VFLGVAVAGCAATREATRRAEADGPFRLDVHSVCGVRMTEREMEAHAATRTGADARAPCGGLAALAVDALDDDDDFARDDDASR